MTEPGPLIDFIKYCTSIFRRTATCSSWDHGGGSLTGTAMMRFLDGSMSLDEINTALKRRRREVRFHGFERDLMATLETALVTEQYADI
jgi:hypothetical protein